MSAHDAARSVENPFAVWSVFRGIHRWFFAYGCPPTIAELAGWTRVLHVSVLLAAMGLVASVLGLTAVWGLQAVNLYDPWDSAALGLSIGGLLLVPLSRWMERPWWLAAVACLACTLWFATLPTWWEAYDFVLTESACQAELVWWAVTTTMGLGLAIGMLSPRQPRSWLMPVAVVGVCTVSAVMNAVQERFQSELMQLIPLDPNLSSFLLQVQPIALFVTLTSAALGIRLWGSDRNREPETRTDWTAPLAEVFAVWTIFRGLPRWYFARGCPPTLQHELRWVRGLRTSILLGTVGLASSWISTLWLFLEKQFQAFSPFDGEGSLMFMPGAWFGLLVLLPLSRWMGRG
ncbi:MAG TPA: hypothetical protein VM165_03630 [Planctomycetaceae bacterium]|nr:hypothetical protein [Planctomycetaceae bacterium]